MNQRLWPVWLLSIGAFLLATAMAWGVLGAMPHLEDEHANLFQAKVFASGRITAAEVAVSPAAFYVPFILHVDGRVFGKYTPGYPLLLALGALIGQPWLINALAAALSVWGVYLLGRDLYNHEVGVLAAALGAVSPMTLMLSGTLLAHTTTLTALVFGTWGFIRARRSDEQRPQRFAVLAGGAIGWALISRPWTAIAIALPLALIAFNDLFNHPRRNIKRYAVMLLVCLLVLSIWPLYNWLATGSPTTNTYTLWWSYDRVGFGDGYGRLDGGHSWDRALQNFDYDFPDLGATVLGWPAIGSVSLTWVVVLLGLLWPEHNRRDWALLIPPVLLIVAHLAYWARGGGLFGPRYYAEGLPFLWIIAARGLLKISATTRLHRAPRYAVQVVLPFLLAYNIVFTIEPRLLQGFDAYGLQRRHADRIATAQLAPAIVFVRAVAWTDYADLAWQNAPEVVDSPVLFALDYGPLGNLALTQAFPQRKVYYYDRAQSIPLVAGR
ncbi:MAG: glycosyltransferase family 39 protein [Thermoflexales bacterium]|nr:glycosyltransferase family 39 protein [Thermoflexales bacterium]